MDYFHHLMISAAGELVGMAILILIGNGIVATVSLNKTNGVKANWLAISTGWFVAIFLALTVSKFIGSQVHSSAAINFYSTGMCNPVGAVISFFQYIKIHTESGTANLIGWLAFWLLSVLVFQVIGAAIGQLGVILIFKKHYDATEDPMTILRTHATYPNIKSIPNNFMAEAIGTFLLFFIAPIISKSFSSIDNSTASFFTGLLVGGLILSLGSTTGFALNPTRDLVPRLVHQVFPFKNKGSSKWEYSWVPVAAPFAGGAVSLLAAPGLFY